MDAEERQRLIAAGVMDDENDMYPRICECCPAEYAGSADAAKMAGWMVGFDGWICATCNAPQQPECGVRGIISHGVACGFVIASDHGKCGYKGSAKCPHMLVPNVEVS